MKNLLLFVSMFMIAVQLSAQTQTWSEVKIHAGRQDLDRLARLGLAVEEGFHGKDGTWTTVLSREEVAKLERAGYHFEVLHSDYSKYITDRNRNLISKINYINSHREAISNAGSSTYAVPQKFHLGTMGGYLHLQEVLDELDSMRANYPNLISVKMTAGSNTSIEDRPIYYVRISNTPNQATGKPKVMYNALTHAREPMGMQQLIFFMWYLLENYSTSDEIKYLVDNLELCFIPVSNPDGYAYNHEMFPEGGGMWRKNRRDNGGGEYGVDLNRNFGFKWGWDNSGSSPFPVDETYRGTAPFSEPETRIVRDFCMDQAFSISMSYHTYSDYTMFPWCWQTEFTPDSALQVTYARYLTKQNGYLTGTPGQILYNTNGDVIDWQYGDTIAKPKIISFTTETGNQTDGFWPSPDRIIPLAQETMYANLMIAHFALRYAEAHDRSPVILSSREGYFHYDFMRYGMDKPASYSVSLHPLDATQFVSTGGPKTFNNPAQLQAFPDSVAYVLKPEITSGDSIRFVYEIDNGMFTYRDTVMKYFGPPLVIFRDSASTMSNWSSTKWNVTGLQYHSAPGAITDSRSGNYGNNANAAVTTINGLNLQGSPVAVINYWSKWQTEQGYDYVQFNLSGNSGPWIPQKGRYTKTGFYMEDPGQPLYDGFQPGWVEEQVVATGFADKSLKMQFLLKSDMGTTFDGFYFDDVTVTVVDMTQVGTDPHFSMQPKLSDPFPNPASASVTIRYALDARCMPGSDISRGSLILMDSRGFIAGTYPVPINQNFIIIDVNDLDPGLYFYRIIGTFGSTEVKKLVIIHS